MRAVIQRVTSSSIKIEGEETARIGKGFNLLLGVTNSDTKADIDYLVGKISKMRIFEDENGKMNLSPKDINAEILVISQFTLYADTRKGNRPSFIKAGNPSFAEKMYNDFIKAMKIEMGEDLVKTGRFGADMKVEIHNDGPVTIIMES